MRLLLNFFLFTALLSGVELELDKEYYGPKKLTVSQLGVSMGLPHGWEAVAKQDEGLILSQKGTKDTMVLRAKRLTASEAGIYLSEPRYVSESTKVYPRERIVQLNSRIYRRSYAATGGQTPFGVLIYVILGPQERAVVMKVQYDKANESAVKATAMNIVQTLSFTPTRQLQNALHDLDMRLKGTHIVFAKRSGGHDDKRELWLCSNQRYILQAEQTAADGMSRMQEYKEGKWSVEDEQLILQGDDGLETLINVRSQEHVLIFDGHRSYELENHKCK